MKLSKIINPAKLFKNSRRSVSRTTNNSSFNSSCSSDKPNTSTMYPNYRDCLKQAFQMIDRDRDGKINKEDLQSLLTRLGPDPPRPDELMKLMLSEDGFISFDEFYAIAGSAFSPPSCDVETRTTFDFFDSDHNGKIMPEELFQVFKTIPDCTLDDCRRMITNVDIKGHGFVCFDDFRRMMLLHQS
ncbi:probable calcium-binding protein CML36 [Henckelia pumila]|uniref:probable calcium-binding protein CML36 n=1 Tax=Henckelia pumila TaxID=405737 RepID=UPI003C6E9BF6